MIVWGGYDSTYLGSGGRYNPATDTWASINTAGAPSARSDHTAAWTGDEMIVWGGYDDTYLATGARYTPSTDSWTPTSTATGVPSSRQYPSSVWTGSEMIIWGGLNDSGDLDTGARYNPVSDIWSSMSTIDVPTARHHHTAIWTGQDMIIWGGSHNPGWDELGTGGRYNPGTDTWSNISTIASPSPRSFHTAVWTGNEMIVWGGFNPVTNNTGIYYPYDTYTVGGTITGLAPGNSVVLENNASYRLTVTANGSFTFARTLVDGSSYDVGVVTHPSDPNQLCSVTGGSGTISGADIMDISIVCINTYKIGGMISGLETGNEAVLQNNGGDDLTLSANGSFVFDTELTDGSSYAVSVLTQPTIPNQMCTVSNGAGNLAGADVTNVSIICVNTYKIGGTISGLTTGNQATLQNNAGDDLIINTNGGFNFPTELIDGGVYDITVLVQPTTPNQTCMVTNGNGTVAGADVSDISVTCTVDQLFADVAPDHWAYEWIQRLAISGITSGCGGNNYCPDAQVNRAAMAIFLERSIHGRDYIPPGAMGTLFDDVPASYWAAAWIEQLAVDGVTGGCGGNNYCPEDPVTRAAMAIFLLRAEHGAAYAPPPAEGSMFNDVPLTHWAASWIEQLAREGITGGCGGGNYCPDGLVKRDQMAAFLVRTFNL